MLRIDAHQHFWQRSQPFDYRWLDAPEHRAIAGDRMPDDLAPQLRECGIDASVFVQTQHDVAENRWVLELAEQHPFVAGVVGWVDLASDRIESQLDEFVGRPKFVGVRHVVQDEPDDDFIVRPAVLRGLRALERRGVPFDLLFYVRHLKHAVTLAREVPDLPMVIDHLSKPRIRERILDDWATDLRRAAEHPRTFCKLSGLVTEANHRHWTIDDLRPYVDVALEAFGPARCMYGSDWPVCELAGSYRQVHDAMVSLTAELSASERSRIFGGTAIEFYRLNVERSS